MHSHADTAIYTITLILAPQPEGGYTVTCKELPELITEGDSVDEALENVQDAFIATLELYEHLKRSLPDSITAKRPERETNKPPLQIVFPATAPISAMA